MTHPTAYELAQLARSLQEASLPADWLHRVRVPEWQDLPACLQAAGAVAAVWETPTPSLASVPFCVAADDKIVGVVITNDGRNFRGYWQQRRPALDGVTTSNQRTVAWHTAVDAAIDFCIELHECPFARTCESTTLDQADGRPVKRDQADLRQATTGSEGPHFS